MPNVNIHLSALILFFGSLLTQIFRVMTNLGCKSIYEVYLTSVTRRIISSHPYSRCGLSTSQHSWRNWEVVRGHVIGGDEREDSPGHSAKYGSCSVMRLEMDIVIDIQLLQVCHFLLQFHHYLIFSFLSYARVMESMGATVWKKKVL